MDILPQEFTLTEAKQYLKDNGKTKGYFYNNVFGWSTYLTLEPTFATPTGKLKEYPRKILVTLN